jgi:hypothetical protein
MIAHLTRSRVTSFHEVSHNVASRASNDAFIQKTNSRDVGFELKNGIKNDK